MGTDVLSAVEDACRDFFGTAPDRASISFLGVEPIEVMRFVANDEVDGYVYVTKGMSRYPMTGAEELLTDVEGPRAELVVHCRGEAENLWRQLAILAAAPVVEGLVFQPGALVDLTGPIAEASRCTGVVVGRPEEVDPEFRSKHLSAFIPPLDWGAGFVEFLQVFPATANELAWARVKGAQELHRRWIEAGTDLSDVHRVGVSLS